MFQIQKVACSAALAETITTLLNSGVENSLGEDLLWDL
jgi:hypothetical protein